MLIWIVNKKDVEDMPFNEGVAFIADASSLEIPPGRWPERLRTEDLGDGSDYICQGWVCDEVMLYIQPSTKTEIHIVND